jgi:pimeloyl-ACP methyl ester carboxylesterase
MGLSDGRPHRRLLDWPDDVIQLADALELERFAALGISGGGPYAAACAWKLLDRITAVGMVSSLAPIDAPGATEGMSPRERLIFRVVGRVDILRRAAMQRASQAVRRDPEAVLANGLVAEVDKKYLQRPEVRDVLVASLREAFRRGGRGPASDLAAYSRPWGFRCEDIRTPVRLWHGDQDANAPAAMGRYLATAIPDCEATFVPDGGHLLFVDRLPEILASVCEQPT